MSQRPARRPSTSGGAAAGGPEAGAVVVRAGCGRTRSVPAADVARAGAPSVWAYTAMAFPECPTCPHRVEPEGPHRVEPEGADAFCAWRPLDAPHPFAALAAWDVST